MTAFYASRKPPGTIGANRRLKNVIPYKKYGTAQPPGRASKQQADLTAVWRDAEALCAKLKGSK
jgi:hypothetical protein